MANKNRLLSFLVCALFGFVGGAVSTFVSGHFQTVSAHQKIPQDIPDTVYARRFVVVNDYGHEVASLGFGSDGVDYKRGPRLSIHDDFKTPGERPLPAAEAEVWPSGVLVHSDPGVQAGVELCADKNGWHPVMHISRRQEERKWRLSKTTSNAECTTPSISN